MKITACILLAAILLCGCTSPAAPANTEPSTITPPSSSVTTTSSSEPTTPTTIVTQPNSATMLTTAATTNSETSAPVVLPDTIEDIIASMTLEQRVGQLFLARCPAEDAIKAVEKYYLGGFTLYATDFYDQTKKSMKNVIASYQNASYVPMFIAVDEEGGNVVRVSKYSAFRDAPFASGRDLFAQGGLDLIITTEIEKCQLLTSLGINVNLAPVCDITTDEASYMYPRSLGQSPEITAQFVRSVIRVQRNNGIGGALKHFPGYGNNSDTHTGIAVDNRSLDTLENIDLVPFAAGIESGCDAIMVSHTFVNCLDSEIPASLSAKVHKYLREEMGFVGVIVTDDLGMDAITDLYGAGEAAVMALECGNDLLCVTDYATQYDAVLAAVKSGRVSEETVNESVTRILLWKQSIGLLS